VVLPLTLNFGCNVQSEWAHITHTTPLAAPQACISTGEGTLVPWNGASRSGWKKLQESSIDAHRSSEPLHVQPVLDVDGVCPVIQRAKQFVFGDDDVDSGGSSSSHTPSRARAWNAAKGVF